eukprot:g28691.t1
MSQHAPVLASDPNTGGSARDMPWPSLVMEFEFGPDWVQQCGSSVEPSGGGCCRQSREEENAQAEVQRWQEAALKHLKRSGLALAVEEGCRGSICIPIWFAG